MDQNRTQEAGSLLGTCVGQYRIKRVLGRGGMGTVYEAVHESIGQRAAVKVLSGKVSNDPRHVARFMEEARLISLVQHAGLVKIFDFNRLPDGTLYILMERLEGESLWGRYERLAKENRCFTTEEALRITRQLAVTLAHVHGKGILHRDLKPENVFLVPDPEAEGGERAKLLDFGIAKLLADSADQRLTAPGVTLGTPTYMSPEHFGPGELTHKSDVYALGVMLYELLAGKLPFEADNALVLMRLHTSASPPPLPPSCPRPLSQLVGEMLAKAPAERPDMEQISARLAEMARPQGLPLPIPRLPWQGVLLAGGALLLLILFRVFIRGPAGHGLHLGRQAASMTLIPAGSFQMGSASDEIKAAFFWCKSLIGDQCDQELYEREQPVRQVQVSSFLLDTTEVTNEDFAAWLDRSTDLALVGDRYVMQAGVLLLDLYPSYEPSGIARRGARYVSRRGFESKPVNQVTWMAALRYCQAQGKRLPTEAEWEFAARGPEGTRFPWGDDEPRCDGVSFDRKSGRGCAGMGSGPAEVGRSPQDRTPQGVMDLAGNVAEWVMDSYRQRYPACPSPCRDPQVQDEPAPDGSDLRVVRGGAWARAAESCRATGRMRWAGNKVTSDIGFRCAMKAKH